jgi:hypothetical protein
VLLHPSDDLSASPPTPTLSATDQALGVPAGESEAAAAAAMAAVLSAKAQRVAAVRGAGEQARQFLSETCRAAVDVCACAVEQAAQEYQRDPHLAQHWVVSEAAAAAASAVVDESTPMHTSHSEKMSVRHMLEATFRIGTCLVVVLGECSDGWDQVSLLFADLADFPDMHECVACVIDDIGTRLPEPAQKVCVLHDRSLPVARFVCPC